MKRYLYALLNGSDYQTRFRLCVGNKVLKIILQFFFIPSAVAQYFKIMKEGVFDNRLAIAMIVKNESPYIIEFIEFHLKQGVELFIIYDNDSVDDLCVKLKKYIDVGIVDYYPVHGQKKQNDSYNRCLHEYSDKVKYIAFIDADEFLVPSDINGPIAADIIEDMFEIHEMDAYVVNWVMYGSNGFIKRNERGDSVLLDFTRRSQLDFQTNKHFKCIVNPRKVFCFTNPHMPILKFRCYAKNEKGMMVQGTRTIGSYEKLRVNHYFTKSKEEFEIKRIRGKADVGGGEACAGV